jgi:hypothetical protein
MFDNPNSNLRMNISYPTLETDEGEQQSPSQTQQPMSSHHKMESMAI